MSQTHLDRVQALNLGSFYTPDFVVKIVYEMLLNALSNVNLKAYTLLDSSCGYGNFLQMPLKLQNSKNADFAQKIGIDIDEKALQKAGQNFAGAKNPPLFLHKNSLLNVNRANFGIKKAQSSSSSAIRPTTIKLLSFKTSLKTKIIMWIKP